MIKIKKAVIPVAGLGTRFLPASKSIPKELFPIVDKPSIQYIVEEAVRSGIEEILFITARGKTAIEDHFDISYELQDVLTKKNKPELIQELKHIEQLAEFSYIRQKHPKGLGHAILCAKNFIGNEPFAVLLGEDIIDSTPPCLQQLISIYCKYNKSTIALFEVPQSEVHLYGIVGGEKISDHLYKLNTLVEKPNFKDAPSCLAIPGHYVLSPYIFELLENTHPDKNGEIQLTPALQQLALNEGLYGYTFNGSRFDAGDKLGFLKANIAFALKRPEFKDKILEFLKDLQHN